MQDFLSGGWPLHRTPGDSAVGAAPRTDMFHTVERSRETAIELSATARKKENKWTKVYGRGCRFPWVVLCPIGVSIMSTDRTIHS